MALRFLAIDPDTNGENCPALFLEEETARGVEFRRARIVSEPLAAYIRFEYESTALNVAAGEQIRWLPRHTAPDLLVPLADFWLFDDRFVRFGFFAGDGAFLRHDLCDDLEVARSCAEAFERVWCRAIPHDEYRPT